MMDLDLKLIGGEFLYDDLPENKEYLKHYFSGEIEIRFLVYYLNFQELTKSHSLGQFHELFIDHTGIACDRKWIYKVIKRIGRIEFLVKEAEKNSDLETLANIKLGVYKVVDLR